MAVPVLVRRVVEAYRRQPAASPWDDFLANPSPELFDLQSVFHDLAQGHLTPAESWWVDHIERRRAELLADTTVLTYRDFGAGQPDTPRTEEELVQGVAAERRVCDLARASVPREWGLLLFRLVRRFQPSRLIELGSALGISGAYQAAALSLNDGGHLYTLEGCPEMARHARQTLRSIEPDQATVVRGRFQDTLGHILDRMGQVDFAFIDGHHDQQATLEYWQQVRGRLTPGSMAVFDDIDWSAGMQRAWKHIHTDPAVSCSIDLGKFGCCLCHDSRFTQPRHVNLPYPPS